MQNIDKNFYDTLKILNVNEINYCCTNGTMLGLQRDGDLIPWDRDIDIMINAKSFELSNLIRSMKKKGFTGGFHRKIRPGFPVIKFHRTGGRVIEFNIPTKNSKDEFCLEWYECEIPDIYKKLNIIQKLTFKFLKLIGRIPLQETQVGIQPCMHIDDNYKKIACVFLKNFFPIISFLDKCIRKITKLDFLVGYYSKNLDPKKTKNFDYYGINCLIPIESEKACTDLYGSNWNKPIRNKHYTDFFKDSKEHNYIKEL